MSERRKPPAMPADGWFWSAKGNKVGLEIAHQPALEYLHRDRLSPSSAIALTSNGSCAVRSMSEKLLGSSPSPLDPTEVGTLWHAVAESLYGLAPENRTEATATRLLSKACAKVYPPGPLGSPSMNRWLTLFTTVRNAGWGTFEMEDPTSIDIVSLEEEVADVEVNGVPFLGYIDRTRRAEDGSLVVGDFKGLALDTPIPTPTGWTTMGALEVGDQVLGTDGTPISVTIKSQVHNRPCYRVSTFDGGSVTADNVHLWEVTLIGDSNRPDETVVVNTDELARLFARRVAEGRPRTVVVNNAKPLQLPDADLPLDPWVLGAWLGDGDTQSGRITAGSQDVEAVRDILTRRWGYVREHADHRNGTVMFTPSAPDGIPSKVRSREVLVAQERQDGYCDWGHVNHSGDCLECGRLRREARSLFRENMGEPSNTKPAPGACPYGHPYPADAVVAGRCKKCHALVERARRSGDESVRGQRWNVKPRPSNCEYDHPLKRVPSGDLVCLTCVGLKKAALDNSLGKPCNRTKLTVGKFIKVPNPDAARLTPTLRSLGLIGNKHVPAEYLRGSQKQRLALLQGLMDTDGGWNATRKRAVFCNTNKRLADAVAEIVTSLGVNAQRHTRPYKNATRPDATAYTVEFKPVGFNPFLLPRKADQVAQWQKTATTAEVVHATRRVITGIEPTESVPTQCIQVDAWNSLYLCGQHMLPTHNTSQKMPANITRFGDDHGDQLRLYVIAKRELGCDVSGAELLYTRNTIAKVKPVAVSQSKLNATASMFKQAWRKQTSYVEDGWIPTSTSPLCGWCPLVAVCPSAKKEGLVDRSNSAIQGLVIENRTGLPDEPAPVAARGRDHSGDENEPATSAVDGTAAAPSPITAVTDADLEKAYADLPPDPYGDVPARTRRPAITDAEIETARPDGHVEYDDLPDEPVVRPTRVAALNGHTPNGAGTQTSPGRVAVLEVPDHIIAAASAEAAEIGQRRTQELRDETTNIKESLMHKSHTDAPLAEGKAYDETVGDKLNAAGFAAGAVFSLTMTAGEELAKRGASLRHDQLKEVTNLLLTISNNVAEELTGRYGDLHGGGHKLARYALFTSMKSDPLPWNASADNWKRWVKKTTTKCLYTCNVAIDAYYDGVTPIDFDLLSQIEGDPWAVGSDTQ